MKNNPHTYAVILAGGSGTRFWPMSRSHKPKQFLKVIGEDTLFQKTIKRVLPLIAPANVFIVTNAQYKSEIQRQIASFKIPSANILLEPEGKNTAPAIGWAAACIYKKDPQSLLAVLPSDHLILDEQKYRHILMKAFGLAQQKLLVTFGIVPTRPETGYGYLKIGKGQHHGKPVNVVEKFTEKPSLKAAQKFIQAGNYWWNSGMFVWKAEIILHEFENYLTPMFNILAKGVDQKSINRNWKQIKGISIDYGILEKSKRVAAVEAKDIGWSDLGSWESLFEVLVKDRNQNIHKGKVIDVQSKNTLVWSHKKLVATIGLKDMIVIDTEDALLVCPKTASQSVREIVQLLKKENQLLI